MRWLRRWVGKGRYHRLVDELTRALQAGDHERAETTAGECVKLATAMYGEVHAEITGPLYALASAQLARGKLDEASQSCERAIAIARELESGTREPPLHQLWEQRAAIADRQGDEEVFGRALQEVVAAGADEPLVRAAAHNRLGLWHGRAERYTEAAEHFEQALDLRRRHDDPLRLAEVLHNAATFRGPDVEPPVAMFDEALEIAQKHLSPEASQLEARIAHNYGVLKQEQLDDERAEALYRRALAAFERDHDATDPALRPTLARLGRLLQAQRRFDEAVQVLKRAHSIADQELGADHEITGRLALWLGDANSSTYR